LKQGLIHKNGDVVGGRYRIEAYIGAGGMQEVYRALDLLLRRSVALKVPKNNSAEKRFKRSAIVSAKVNHANVAKTLDYFEEAAGKAYLIEELVPGKDLSRVLRDNMNVIDPLMVAYLFHRLAKGVAASHHAGVVHRDLKPSNVIAVGGAILEDLKITDFGIAKMAEEVIAQAVEGGDESLTASATAIGALPYMAPEMIKSMKDAGKPSDIWSLGAMIFELLAGKKPFGAGLPAVPAILEAKMPQLPSELKINKQFSYIQEAIYSLVSRCMQSSPTARPTADELVSECGNLCYPVASREFGEVSKFENGYWGFIKPDKGKGVFFHKDCLYASSSISVGARVWFARHSGGGNDRAFPVIKIKSAPK
jgi:serine/threonine-protein kinase